MKVNNIGSNQTEITWTINGQAVGLLYSYKTCVAGFTGCTYFKTDTKHSVTTSKHVNKYIRAGMGSDASAIVPQSVLDDVGRADSDPSRAWVKLSAAMQSFA